MKTGCEQKTKWKRLKRRLALPRYAINGILETLWQITLSNAPDGAIGKLTNEDIAAEMEWAEDPDALVDALRDGWLDDAPDLSGRLIVHDWSEHCPKYVKGNMANAGKEFADIVLKAQPLKSMTISPLLKSMTISPPTIDTHTSCAYAIPNQTKPNQTEYVPPNPRKRGPAAATAAGVCVPTESFEQFWRAYPKRTGKGAALKSFLKIKPDVGQLTAMLNAIEWQSKTEQWTKDQGQFIPLPATWLNQRRWEDEPLAPRASELPDSMKAGNYDANGYAIGGRGYVTPDPDPDEKEDLKF